MCLLEFATCFFLGLLDYECPVLGGLFNITLDGAEKTMMGFHPPVFCDDV